MDVVPNTPFSSKSILTLAGFVVVGIALAGGIILLGNRQPTVPRANTRDSCQAQNAIVWDGTACPPNTIQIDTIDAEQIGTQADQTDSQTRTGGLCCKPNDINVPTLTPRPVTPTEEPAPPQEPTITKAVPTSTVPTAEPPTSTPPRCELPKPELSIWCPAGCDTVLR